MVQTPSANDTFFGLDISDAKKSFLSLRRKISKRHLLIEFGVDYITYCEAKVVKDQVYYSKINRVSIDKSAIERGTPTETEAMASFLTQIIEEDQIWAHRVGITLPPQAALSRLIYLPEHLSYQEAIEYISNPSTSGFQFPISIENTDFDIIPLNIISTKNKDKTKAYFLNSVPRKLIDNIVKTLEIANLELHSLDVAFSSLERLAITSCEKNQDNEVFILIELALECSHFYIIGNNGPVHVSTLAAIKAFEANEDYKGAQSIEENTINSEEYLEISKLDLKILFSEVKVEIEQFIRNYDLNISEIILSGINSSHPGIKNLFEDNFMVKTSILRAISSKDIGNINLAKPIIMQDLNRLIGLGLSMIQAEEIHSEYLNTTKFLKKDANNILENNNLTDTEHTQDEKSYESNPEEDKLNIKDINTQAISFDEFLKINNEEEIYTTINSKDQIKSLNINNDSYSKKIKNKSDYLLDFDSNIKANEKNQSQENNLEINNDVNDELNLNTSQNQDKNVSPLLDFDSNIKANEKNQSQENNLEINNDVNDELNLNTSQNKRSDIKKIQNNKTVDNIEDDFNMPES